jgi:hypothetical protein
MTVRVILVDGKPVAGIAAAGRMGQARLLDADGAEIAPDAMVTMTAAELASQLVAYAQGAANSVHAWQANEEAPAAGGVDARRHARRGGAAVTIQQPAFLCRRRLCRGRASAPGSGPLRRAAAEPEVD